MSLEEIIELQKLRTGIYGTGNQDALTNTIFDNFSENPAYRIVTHKNKVIGVHFITKTGQNRHKKVVGKKKSYFIWLLSNLICNFADINRELTYYYS